MMGVVVHALIIEPVAPASRAIALDDFLVFRDYNTDCFRLVDTALGGALGGAAFGSELSFTAFDLNEMRIERIQ